MMILDGDAADIADRYSISPMDAQYALWSYEWTLDAEVSPRVRVQQRELEKELAGYVSELLELIEKLWDASKKDRRLLDGARAVITQLVRRVDFDLTNPDELQLIHSWAVLEHSTRPDTTEEKE